MVVLATIVSTLLLFVVLSQISDWVLKSAMFIGFTLHLLVIFAVLPHVPFLYPDVNTFHSMTIDLLDGGQPTFDTGVDSFIGFQALLYVLFGRDFRVVSLFNSLASVVLILPALHLMRELYPQTFRSGRLAALMILFLPISFLQLTLPLRDALATLLFISLLCSLVFSMRYTLLWLGPGVVLFFMTYLLRYELALLVAIGLLSVSMFYLFRRFNIKIMGFVVSGTLSGVFGLLFFRRLYSVESLERLVNARASGRTAYLEGFTYESWIDVIVAAPVRALYFQFVPFPTQVEGITDLIPVLMLPILIFLTVAAYRSVIESDIEMDLAVFLITIYAAGIVGYGLIDSNVGTVIRHRVPFELLLIILSAPVLERCENLLVHRFEIWPQENCRNHKDNSEA